MPNTLNYLSKINKNIFFYILIWLSFFIPLNLNPETLFSLNFIDLIRLFVPIISIIIFIFFFKKKIYLEFFSNSLINLFPVYIAILSFFLIINEKNNSLLNLYWFFIMIAPYIYLCFFQKKIEYLKYFLIISIFLISLVYFFYLIEIFYTIISKQKLLHLYGIYGGKFDVDNLKFYPPRSSGLARMGALCAISLIIYIFLKKNKSKYTLLKLTTLIFLLSTTLLFQSRTMNFIIIFLLIIFTFIIFKKKFNLRLYLFTIFFSIMLAICYNSLLIYQNKISLNNPKLDKNKIHETILITKDLFIRTKLENYSSSRFDNWSKVIEISKKNIIIGYGFQADRKLINQSIHNVYLYSLICGGLAALMILLIISLRCAWTTFFILKNYIFKEHKLEFCYLISIFISVIFLMRGVLETSYAIYSIDYLLFIICFFINEYNYKNYFK